MLCTIIDYWKDIMHVCAIKTKKRVTAVICPSYTLCKRKIMVKWWLALIFWINLERHGGDFCLSMRQSAEKRGALLTQPSDRPYQIYSKWQLSPQGLHLDSSKIACSHTMKNWVFSLPGFPVTSTYGSDWLICWTSLSTSTSQVCTQ